MKLKRLIAKNVYSFDSIDLQLDEYDLIQVTGENLDEERVILVDEEETQNTSKNVNGVGKTNIYNCIIQALYSRDIYKTKKAFLKNLFINGKFSIELELEIEDTDYKISYTNDECILYKNGVQFLSGRASVTEFFEELIPFELFLHLTYISSSITFPFFTATPSQQKQFIELVFSDLNKFKDSIPKLKEKLAEEIKNSTKIETEKELLTKQLDVVIEKELELVELPEQLDISSDIHALETRINKQESIEQEINLLKKSIEKEIKEVSEPNNKLPELQERLGKGKALISVTNDAINKLEKVSKESICSICGSEIDVATNQKLLKEKKEYLSTLRDTLKTVRESIETSTAQQEAYEVYQQKIEERKLLKDRVNSLQFDEVEYNKNCASLVKLTNAQEEQKQKLKEAQEQRELVVAHNTKVAKDTELKEKAIERLGTLSRQEETVNETIVSLKLLIEICDKVIVSKQIPKRLQVLQRFINIELANFTSQYTVNLEMKNNKIKPSVIKNGKTYPIENISTGERARLNVSLIFAIRNILIKLRKEIYNINLLYIDELVAVLDYSGKHLLVNTLKKFDLNIFLISHDYVFPEVELINLVKENNKTSIMK